MDDLDEQDILEHFGVKGMKWGVRKDKGHEGERAKTKKIARLDRKFERKTSSFNMFIDIHNEAARHYNKNDVERINNKPQYKGQSFLKDTPLRQRYYKEHQKAFLDALDAAAASRGTNASGTKKYGILEINGQWKVVLEDVKGAKHAVDDNVVGLVTVNYDENGYIVSVELAEDLAQSAINNVLEHFGVKGMKWGVRRDAKSRPSSGDAKKSDAVKKKRREKGAKSLTNKELKAAIERMRLEQQYKEMNKSTVAKGAAAAKNALNVARTLHEAHTLASKLGVYDKIGKLLVK